MASHEVRRECADRPAERLAAAVEHLTRHGYTVRERTSHHVKLDYEGSLLGGGLAGSGHTLDASCDDRELHFRFASGWVLSLADGDPQTLAARVDAALARMPAAPEARSEPAPIVVERQVLVARCKFCSEITPVDLERCRACGAAKFV